MTNVSIKRAVNSSSARSAVGDVTSRALSRIASRSFSAAVSFNAEAIAKPAAVDTFEATPDLVIAYHVTLIPASAATSSRRSLGTRRRPIRGSPTSS